MVIYFSIAGVWCVCMCVCVVCVCGVCLEDITVEGAVCEEIWSMRPLCIYI